MNPQYTDLKPEDVSSAGFNVSKIFHSFQVRLETPANAEISLYAASS